MANDSISVTQNKLHSTRKLRLVISCHLTVKYCYSPCITEPSNDKQLTDIKKKQSEIVLCVPHKQSKMARKYT